MLAILFYASLIPFQGTWLESTFNDRGWVPYVIVFFTAWALMILLVKQKKVKIQARALKLQVTPEDHDWVLSTQTVDHVLDNLWEIADDPSRFVLLNRIQIGLANLRNMGRVGDLGDVFRQQAEYDEAAMESGYGVVRGLIWAIPVLGFVGTVIGLSAAIASFGSVLADSSNIEALKVALTHVTSGLATAFETTLQALLASLVLHLLLTGIKRSEERMLDACNEYCQKKILGRVRIRDTQTD